MKGKVMRANIKEVFAQLKLMVYGKKLLFKIIAQNKINLEMDFVIILPEQDIKINVCALLYLNLLVKQFEKQKDKLEKQGVDVIRANEKFLVIAKDERLTYDDAKIIFPRLNGVIKINDYDMTSIISRYLFMPLSSRIVVVSVKEMIGNNYLGLLNSPNVTMDEIVAISIIGIQKKNFIKWKLPQIDLPEIKNKEIREYLAEKAEKELKMNEVKYDEVNK